MALFNYNGTAAVTGSTFTANAANVGPGVDNVGDGQSTVIPVSTATVSFSNTAPVDSTNGNPDYQETTINGGAAVNTGSAAVQGLPSTVTGSPLTVTGPFTSPSTGVLWQATNGSQTTLAGLGLINNNPVTLPNSFVSAAYSFQVDVTFKTTTGGVILGYQNQPLGTTPTNYVPALYVGTDGRLYAELWTGALQPIASPGKVNDGQMHHAVFTYTGGEQTLTLDGLLVGTLNAAPTPLDMVFNQVGTGYTGHMAGRQWRRLSIQGRHQPDFRHRQQPAALHRSEPELAADRPRALPAGLIHNATSLTVDVTFHTSAGGVILGYQNAPLGNVPGNYVPALYVGTDGKLYGSIYFGGLPATPSSTMGRLTTRS